jgi:hypothetical protein
VALYGYAPECIASVFGVYEMLVESYAKHLANSNRPTPLPESRARNLSSPMLVGREQYGQWAGVFPGVQAISGYTHPPPFLGYSAGEVVRHAGDLPRVDGAYLVLATEPIHNKLHNLRITVTKATPNIVSG